MEPTTIAPTGPSLPPTYTEMFQEMGRQLTNRKSDLLKRVLFITWPVLLLVVVGYIFDQMGGFNAYPQLKGVPLFIGVLIYIFLAAIYTAIVRFIFNIEKQIWVDSFFDKKNLAPEESWRISKKLFWPALIFRMKLWVRYYVLPFVLIIVVFAVVMTAAFSSQIADMGIVASVALLIFFAALIGYGFYIRVELRYTWFLFLDKFGPTVTYAEIIKEMKVLNSVSKKESFKRSLAASIGTDVTNRLAMMTTNIISSGISQFGGVGRLVGGLTRAYGQELSHQATQLGNISAQYILYRFARKEAFGQEQSVNETIYNLK